MISYRKLAMRVLGHPLRVPTNTPRPASHRVTALAPTAAMVAGMAAPAYAGTYYIDNNGGDITVTKDAEGNVYVKRSNKTGYANELGEKDEDNNVIIKSGAGTDTTKNPNPGTGSSESGSTGGGSSEGGTPATSAAKSASATLKVEDSENEDKDMVYPGDTKGGDSSDGSGEENENQSTEKTQTSDTTDGKNTGAGSSDPESKGSDGGTTGSESGGSGSDGTSGSENGGTGGEENDPKPGGTPTPAEGTESTESNRSAPESQFTYTGASLKVADANDDEETPTESTTALETAADNFKAAAQNVIRIINKLVSNESTGKDNTLNVTLDNVNINASKSNNAALSVEGAGDTKITLKGNNKLTSGDHHAGLEHNEKSDDGSSSVGTGKLTITSEKEDGKDTGSLTATGDSGAAGIGGAWSKGAGTIEIAGGNITAISPISQSGRNDNDGGAGIGSGAKATGSTNTNIIISGGTIVNAQGGFGGDGIGGGSGSKNITVTIEGGTIETAQGGQGYSIFDGGSGIRSGSSLSISGGTISAAGGSGKSGGAGIASSGTFSISDGKIEQATGGRATGEDGTGGDGIHSNGTLTIKGGEIQQTSGGDATGKGGTGGNGIRSDGSVKIWGGTITKATGGSGKSGGDGIGSYGALTIFGSAKIETAQGGASTNGTGGDGIHSGSVVKISGDTITKATGGNATGENSTGGSGIVGSFVNVAGGTINTTGGSGKSGGAGVSTESGIVSIGNSDTPLDLTATAPDADNAIRGRDGKKLDEIIHLEENGKRGLVKLVENGVTRLFHNGVYTKSIYPAVSKTHTFGEWVITKEPTCTEKGERQRSCTISGCVVTETEELPALGHQWSDWTPVKGDNSREYRICEVCNEVEYRDVSHNSDSSISTGLRVLDPAQANIIQNVQLVQLSQINHTLYIYVAQETASLQGDLSDLTDLRSKNIKTVVFSTVSCTSTLSLSDVAALGAGSTPFTLSHSGSTATFTVGGADHSALLR